MKCPECGSQVIRNSQNELVCSNCGLVVGRVDDFKYSYSESRTIKYDFDKNVVDVVLRVFGRYNNTISADAELTARRVGIKKIDYKKASALVFASLRNFGYDISLKEFSQIVNVPKKEIVKILWKYGIQYRYLDAEAYVIKILKKLNRYDIFDLAMKILDTLNEGTPYVRAATAVATAIAIKDGKRRGAKKVVVLLTPLSKNSVKVVKEGGVKRSKRN